MVLILKYYFGDTNGCGCLTELDIADLFPGDVRLPIEIIGLIKSNELQDVMSNGKVALKIMFRIITSATIMTESFTTLKLIKDIFMTNHSKQNFFN